MTAVTEAPPAGLQETLAPRRGPLFTVWCAKAVASVGRTISVVALPWFVLQITGSGTQTGLAVASSGIGIAVVSFVSGALIDRWSPRNTAITSLATAGVAIGLVPLLFLFDLLALWQLLALVFVASALDSVAGVAVETLVPNAARAARVSLESANAMLAAIDRFALLIMPVVAGVALALLGAEIVLWVDTTACLIAAALLAVAFPAAIRGAALDEPKTVPTTGSPVRRYADALVDGIRVLWRDRVLVSLTLTGTVLNTLVSSLYSVVLLAYAAEVFGSPMHFAGMLAAFGGGSLAGALLYATFGRRFGRRTSLLVSCFGLAGSILALGTVPGMTVTTVLMVLSGVLMAPLGPLVAVSFQERAPTAALGRVLSARNALMLAGVPLGGLLAGIALDVVRLAGTILLIGGIALAVAVVVTLVPALRDLAPPAALPATDEPTAAAAPKSVDEPTVVPAPKAADEPTVTSGPHPSDDPAPVAVGSPASPAQPAEGARP